MNEHGEDERNLVYQSGAKFLMEIWKRDPSTLNLICPVCGAKVIYAPTWELANKLGVHPGAYCSESKQHLSVMFELEPPDSRTR
jgi:hypothetical protein